MSSTIEDVLYSAHKQGKRELLLKSIANTRQENPTMSLEDLYEFTYIQLKEM